MLFGPAEDDMSVIGDRQRTEHDFPAMNIGSPGLGRNDGHAHVGVDHVEYGLPIVKLQTGIGGEASCLA